MAAEEAIRKAMGIPEPEEELTLFSFKVSSEPVGQAFIDEVFDEVFARPTVFFMRAFEDDLEE